MNGKQLKNSILQWAIQGKLVPQDPNDEPTSVLLEKIRAEKARLVKEGKLKKKDLEVKPIAEDEIPFEIPSSWEWCRLGSICDYLHRGKSPKYGMDKVLPIIAQKCNQWDRIYTGKCLFAEKKTIENYLEEQYLQVGDIIINSTGGGTVGRTGYVDNYVFADYSRFVADSHVTVVRANNLVYKKYVYYFLISPFIQIGLEERCSGSTNQIELGSETIRNYRIPLPPLAEQYRIVAKIEELMPLAEKYGAAQEALDEWNQVLPEKLKKSILQEAIQGKLVPQDSTEEAASALLERIREEKQRLVKEGKLKKKDLEVKPIEEDEIPFEIPESWKWMRLGEMVSNQTGLSYNKGDLEKKVDNPIRVLRGGNIQSGSWTIKADDVMIAPEFVKKPNLALQKNTFITPAVTSLEHLGKTALIEKDHDDIVAGGFVLYLIPYYREDILVKYLSFFFQTSFYNKYCKSIANKSGQAFWNLSRQKLMELTIPLPPLAEQRRIVAKIEELFGAIKK